uniref:Glycerol kinase 5 n=1 Tax=Cacopsylla melanoneura TaxID=428564 RepID=A0A8D8W390_9HEMI
MKYILCLDIGTTNIRCAICDPQFKNQIKSIVYDKLQILYLPNGNVEIDPQQLWIQILNLIRKCISTSNISIDQISSLGISAQRNTFVTWDKTSGTEFHNLIVWNDLRAKELVEEYNESWCLWILNKACKLLYQVTRQKRFLAGSVIKFMNAQVSLRLLWILTHCQPVRDNVSKRNVLFGTLDTWLIYKLTRGAHHITDVSHASSTGLYDPFTLGWAQWALSLFRIPVSILPKVLATWHGREDIRVDSEHLGREIPIRASITDQSASMYGLSCVKKGDMKLTMGTGSFMDVNTSDKPHASLEVLLKKHLILLPQYQIVGELCLLWGSADYRTLQCKSLAQSWAFCTNQRAQRERI